MLHRCAALSIPAILRMTLSTEPAIPSRENNPHARFTLYSHRHCNSRTSRPPRNSNHHVPCSPQLASRPTDVPTPRLPSHRLPPRENEQAPAVFTPTVEYVSRQHRCRLVPRLGRFRSARLRSRVYRSGRPCNARPRCSPQRNWCRIVLD